MRKQKIIFVGDTHGEEASDLSWQPEILSYEAPFGVGYLVVNFKLK